jgi:hypothetical protein
MGVCTIYGADRPLPSGWREKYRMTCADNNGSAFNKMTENRTANAYRSTIIESDGKH